MMLPVGGAREGSGGEGHARVRGGASNEKERPETLREEEVGAREIIGIRNKEGGRGRGGTRGLGFKLTIKESVMKGAFGNCSEKSLGRPVG